jgi:hypothetical protein
MNIIENILNQRLDRDISNIIITNIWRLRFNDVLYKIGNNGLNIKNIESDVRMVSTIENCYLCLTIKYTSSQHTYTSLRININNLQNNIYKSYDSDHTSYHSSKIDLYTKSFKKLLSYLADLDDILNFPRKDIINYIEQTFDQMFYL